MLNIWNEERVKLFIKNLIMNNLLGMFPSERFYERKLYLSTINWTQEMMNYMMQLEPRE